MLISDDGLKSAAFVAKSERFGWRNLESDRLFSAKNQSLTRAKYKLGYGFMVNLVAHPSAFERLEHHFILNFRKLEFESRVQGILRIRPFFLRSF